MENKRTVGIKILLRILLYLGIIIGAWFLYNPASSELQTPSSKSQFVYQNF